MKMETPQRPTVFSADHGTQRQLRDAFAKFATGVTMITAPSGDGPVAIVANSFSSVSLEPALVLWCLDKGSNRFGYFEAADHYAIHVLAADQQQLCLQGAKDAHALRDANLVTNADGVPLIDGCLARFECRRVAVHEAGDHLIIVGQVQRTEMRDGAPLTFFEGGFDRLT